MGPAPMTMCRHLFPGWGLPQLHTSSPIYLVELFVIDELEEFRRGVELVGRPDQRRQCDNFGS
eukprot:25696-Pyramimonas_sp.AAC.1